MYKKMISFMLTICLCLGTVISVNAQPLEIASESSTSDNLNASELEFLNKVQDIFPYFIFDEVGNLVLELSEDELIQVYNFNEEDIKYLNQAMGLAADLGPVTLETKMNNSIDSKIHFNDWKVYFTYDDMVAILLTAATAGPAAVYFALVGLGSLLGPVGTALVAAVGVLGIPSLLDFCETILEASIKRKGVWLGVEINFIIPRITCGTW